MLLSLLQGVEAVSKCQAMNIRVLKKLRVVVHEKHTVVCTDMVKEIMADLVWFPGE